MAGKSRDAISYQRQFAQVDEKDHLGKYNEKLRLYLLLPLSVVL
jgi:hypothetical protein